MDVTDSEVRPRRYVIANLDELRQNAKSVACTPVQSLLRQSRSVAELAEFLKRNPEFISELRDLRKIEQRRPLTRQERDEFARRWGVRSRWP